MKKLVNALRGKEFGFRGTGLGGTPGVAEGESEGASARSQQFH